MSVTDRINDHIVGAEIVSAHVDDEEGMHLFLSNGYCLIFLGVIGLVQVDTEKLH